MNTPRYTVTLSSYVAGWSYTAVHTDQTLPGSRPPPTVLVDPLTFDWSTVDDQVPGHLNPSKVTASLASRSAALMPAVEVGDVLQLHVHIGSPDAPGPTLVHVPVLRVTEVVAAVEPDHDPGEGWPVVQTITATDLLADLASTSPTRLGPQAFDFRSRWALLGQALGMSIGCPVWWEPNMDVTLTLEWPSGNGTTIARALANSLAPYAVHHTVTPYVGSGYPAGYAYITSPQAIPDPNSVQRLLLVPHSRWSPFGPLSHVEVPAAYCQVPASARKGREHVINTPVIAGTEVAYGPIAPGQTSFLAVERSSTVELPSADAFATGPRARDVATHLILGEYQAVEGTPVTGRPSYYSVLAGRVFRSDPTALAASPWTFDDFTIYAHEMPQSMAEAVLPYLVPSHPGSLGDGQLVRHVTVTGLDAQVLLTGSDSVSGFVVRGSLTIAGGDLTYRITTSPGEPLTTNPHDTYP